jgi:hypothetical protein
MVSTSRNQQSRQVRMISKYFCRKRINDFKKKVSDVSKVEKVSMVSKRRSQMYQK